jgi:hypothetical protein
MSQLLPSTGGTERGLGRSPIRRLRMTYTLLEAKWKKPICWRARAVRGECASEADPWRIDDLGAEMLIQKAEEAA